MLRHTKFSPITTQIGWIGVDLFFVLSGYLVSGLLFAEYKKTGAVRPLRFLVRRGFKIYPLFFSVLLLHFLYFGLRGVVFPMERILPEIFFYQNYRRGIMGVSWSLAVEEHFYLLLSVAIYMLYRFKAISKKNIVPAACIIIGIACFLLRLARYQATGDSNSLAYFFYTQFRIDALAAGVLISWLSHFSAERLNNFVAKYKYVLLLVLPVLFCPVFIWKPESPPIITAGLTFLYLGFGILLLFMTKYNVWLHNKISAFHLQSVYKLVAWIGVISYSIYLIHLKAGPILSNAFKKYIIPDSPLFLIIFLNFLFSILCGWFLSILIEKPFLRLRDKHFPANKVGQL